ncbi:MAG: TonB-dependent receptor [Cyclobacteriaceae bacterium]|nr:TonB-dependent receptor [Cyclobacteriaceae bacterium]
MNNAITKFLMGFVFSCGFTVLFAQTTISGRITEDGNNEPLIGVNILVKGTVLGTTTDMNGNFNLKVAAAPPVVLIISSVGFERQEIEITQASVTALNIVLKETDLLGQEVVVSASRVEESILQSPVSIEKMDILDIQSTSSDSYYKAIANLKGVDIATSSINFQIINTRGFGSTGNTRFVQLIDGMDTQAPALNFPIGNMNGPSELDVESVELIPGASSALYGPNAFNGVLLINSKNAFDYQGLSFFHKQGFNHFKTTYGQPVSPMYESSLRFAKAFNNKFAFKINLSYQRANDWQGNDPTDRHAADNPLASINGVNPGADRLHFMGDEAAINLAIFPFSSGFNAAARSTLFGPGVTAADYVAGNGIMDLPNHVVSITPYNEVDLIDYGAENKKISTGLYYRINDKMELSYLYNAGFGTSIYTGAQRYSLSNFGIQQHRAQLRGDNFYMRAYGTFENSGGSYITEFLAKRINDLVVGYTNPLFYNQGKGDLTGYLLDYGIEYLRSLYNQGLMPGDVNALAATDRLNAQKTAHDFARNTVDGRYIMNPETGTVTDFSTGEVLTFEQIKTRALAGVVPKGPSFADRSAMYHAEGQYDFKNEIDFMDMQAGASFKTYKLNSKGTIFSDTAGAIYIREIGAYVQASKKINEVVKLSGSVRYDKNQNFKGQVNPRLSGVFTVAKNHNFRTSFQTGFRVPTTQGQYIDLDIISSRLLGGLPQVYESWNIPRISPTGQYLSFKGGSVFEFRNAIFGGQTPAQAASLLVPFDMARPVIPEKVKSLEIGYKSLIQNKVMVDAVYYYNNYTDFITQEMVVIATDDGTGNPNYLSMLTSDAIDGSTKSTALAVYTNRTDKVQTQGAAIGLDYSLPRGYSVGGNYSWNKFISGYDNNTLNDFNTPENKFNVNFGNRKVTDILGFNLTYRWQEGFEWQSSFARGMVPAYQTMDAQVSIRLNALKSVMKIGGSNLLNHYYIQSLGGPRIGAIYYLSITFDELMN